MISFIYLLVAGAFIGNQLLRFHIQDVGVTLLDMFVGILSICWFIFNIASLKKIFWEDPVGKAWIFFIVAAGISLVVNLTNLSNTTLTIALLYLFRWICYSSIFFIVRQLSKEKKQRIHTYLFQVGIVMVVSGLLQYIFYSNLRNLFYLGWDDHMYRLFGTFLDPNFTGGFFVLSSIFIAVKMLRVKITIFDRSVVSKILFLLLTIVATFLTFSRSAIIMFVIVACVLLILENKRKLLFVLFSLLGVFILIASQFFYLENINLFRTASSNERIKSAQNALQIIHSSPVFGVGFNAYRPAQIRMGFREEQPRIISHADGGTDNSLLFILATTGIVGTWFFLHFLYQLFRSFTYNINGKIPVMTTVSIVSLVGIVIDSMFINSLFYPSIMLWLFIVWGLTDYK